MLLNLLPKLFLAFMALAMTASLAFAAITLDAAKSQGLVGERTDGMLGIVAAGSDADVAALVSTINAERLAKYQSIAAKNGTDIEKVKALAGQKLFSGAKAGEYVMNAAGVWVKK